MDHIFISLGSNIGDREHCLKTALQKIEHEIGAIVSASSVYETAPWGFTDQAAFLNQVIEVKPNLSARDALKKALEIERTMGRKREKKWGPRAIDIDLLLAGDQICETEELTLPHPEMHKRRFVLEPLSELAPELIHPVLKKPIAVLLSALNDDSPVQIHHLKST